MSRHLLPLPLLALSLLVGCAAEVADPAAPPPAPAGAEAGLTVEYVGYGFTAPLSDGTMAVHPEYVVLHNPGHLPAKVAGYFLTDGPDFAGDGVVRLPEGAVIPAGGSLHVANYPPATGYERGLPRVGFEEAYGYAPDLEIGGTGEVPPCETVAGRMRLARGETVYLLPPHLGDEGVVAAVREGRAPGLAVSSFAH